LLDKYAALSTQRGKFLIALWVIVVIILGLNLPALEEHIQHSVDPFIPSTLEAKRAQQIISEKIGSDQGDTEILVVKAERGDIISGEGRGYLSTLSKTIESKGREDLKGFVGVISATTLYEEILAKYWAKMNETYREIEQKIKANLTEAHKQFYRAADELQTLHKTLYTLLNKLTEAAQIMYGVPALYLQAWASAAQQIAQANPLQPIPVKSLNEIAYNTAVKMLPEEGKPLTEAYLKAFHTAWSLTFTEEYIKITDLKPQLLYTKAQTAINTVTPLVFTPTNVGEASKIFTDLSKVMNITQWVDPTTRQQLIEDVTTSIVSKESGLSENVLKGLINLGPNATQRDIEAFTATLLAEKGLEKSIIQICLEVGREPTPEALDAAAQNLTQKVFTEIRSKFPTPAFPDSIPKDIYNRLVSGDNKTALILIRFNSSLSEAEQRVAVEALRKIVAEVKQAGFTTLLTGPMTLSFDVKKQDVEDIGVIDKVTILLIFVLGAALIASLIVPTLSLLTVGSALAAALGLLALLAELGFKQYYLLRSMISVVILGAGVDYVIFMIFRYIEERGNNIDYTAAVKRTAIHAGGAVILSASTVLIGFSCLALSSIGILQSIGIGLALGILLTLTGALLAIPSTLSIIKDKILLPRKTIPSFAIRIAIFRRMAHYCVSKPKRVLAIGLLATAALGAVITTISITYGDIEMLPSFESKRGLDAILSSFGAAPLSQTQIVVVSQEPLFTDSGIKTDLYQALDRLHTEISKLDGVYPEYTYGPTRPRGEYVAPEDVDRSSLRQFVDEKGKTFIITTSLKSFYTADEAFTTIKKIREKACEVAREEAALRGAEILVGGGAAFYLDLTTTINRDFFYLIIPAACIGIFVILLVALGSVLLPLRLLATTAMSAVWSIAILTLVFQYGLGAKIYWLTPLLTFSVLMGLGIDYDVFLITRVKEEAMKGLSDEEAVVNAVERTGLVLTAAGLILGSALGSLMLSPNLVLKEMGFALSLAIYIDTFFMRIFLNPSIIVLAKRWNWWPRGLKR
jgi:RND superfamily putative drug exporter